MIPITHPKIAAVGLHPRWTAFPGFSLLFDPSGDHLAPAVAGRRILQVHPDDPAVPFFQRLIQAREALGLKELAERCGFCALPAASWHVTVWDGVNAKNVAGIDPSCRADFAALLAALPGSLDSPLLDGIYDSEGMQGENGRICFRFLRLSQWKNKVLAMELAPDPASAQAFRELQARRQALNERFAAQYGIQPAGNILSPHITLGYFANPGHGARSLSLIEAARAAFSEIMGGERLCFSGMSLYGFTDMASFYR